MVSTSSSAQSPQDHMRRGHKHALRAAIAPGRPFSVTLRAGAVVGFTVASDSRVRPGQRATTGWIDIGRPAEPHRMWDSRRGHLVRWPAHVEVAIAVLMSAMQAHSALKHQ